MPKYTVTPDEPFGWYVEKPGSVPDRFCRCSSLVDAILMRNILNATSAEEWLKHTKSAVAESQKQLEKRKAA